MASKTQALLSMAFSGMFLASCTTPETQTSAAASPVAVETGECHGINTCKGKGECGGKGHSCGGKNSCKGKGWVKMTMEDCKAKAGEFKANK